MAARKLKSGARKVWFVDFRMHYPDGKDKRVRKRSPVNSRAGAEAYERQLRAELLEAWEQVKRRVEPQPKEVPTLAQFATEFTASYVDVHNGPAERASKARILRNHLLPAFGRSKLDAIGAREVDAFVARQLAAGLSPKTVGNQLAVLRRMLNVAHEWRLIPRPAKVRAPRVPKPELDFLDFDEAERLLAGAEPAWRAMVLLGLRTGLRHAELIALRWDHVDLVAGRLHVREALKDDGSVGAPKNGHSRIVPLSDDARQALKAHRHLRGPFVFCAEDGRMLTRWECHRPLRRACQRAGLRRIGWHCLRHSFASALVMRGAPLRVVQELLGHRSIEMTMRYSHLSPDVSRAAVQLLDGGPGRTSFGHNLGTVGCTAE